MEVRPGWLVADIGTVRGIQNRIWVKITTLAATRAPGSEFHRSPSVPLSLSLSLSLSFGNPRRGAAIPRINYPAVAALDNKGYRERRMDGGIDRGSQDKSRTNYTISRAFDECRRNFTLSCASDGKFLDEISRFDLPRRFTCEQKQQEVFRDETRHHESQRPRCVCTRLTIMKIDIFISDS